MNLLGITWGMGARDVGMKAAVDSAQKGVESLNEGLEKQSKIASKSKIPGFLEGLKHFNLGSIAQSVREMAGDTGNLTNSLEAMGAANAKTAKPFVAAMNLSAEAARKMTSRISGMAIGMNVGAETVAEVFKTVHQATGPAKSALDALGLSNSDWVKIVETTGMKVADFTDVMGGMGALFKASAEDEAKFVNNMVELGRVTGLGMQPLKSLKETTDEIGAVFEKLPPGMQRSGKEMMGLIESSARLGGVFREMGSSEEDAVKMGAQTAKMFAEQSVEVERLMKTGFGKGDIAEASPLIKYMTGLGMSFEEARNIVDVGSRDTVKGVQMIQAAFTKYNVSGAQQQAMLSGLSESLGESAAGLGYLAQNGDVGAKALDRMNNVVLTGKFGLKDYGDQAFSSGRTMQESLDLMKSSFETRLRSIARKDVSNFVGDLGKAYKQVGDETIALAGDKTWGPIVKRLSAMQQMGAKGLFIKMDGGSNKAMARSSAMIDAVGGAFDSVSKSMGPVVSIFSELVIVAGPLLKVFGKILASPLGKLGLWGGAIAGLALGFDWLSKSGVKLSDVLAKVVKWVGGAAGNLADWLGNMDWEAIGKKLGDFAVEAVTFIPKAIATWASGAESNSALANAASTLMQNMGNALWVAAKGLFVATREIGKKVVWAASEWWNSWTWDDVAPAFDRMENKITKWWLGLKKNPEFAQFELDTKMWFTETWWAAQDGIRTLFSKVGDGINSAIAILNTADFGVNLGNKVRSFFQEGLVGIATYVHESMRQFAHDALNSMLTVDSTVWIGKWSTLVAEFVIKFQAMMTGIKDSVSGFIAGLFDPKETAKNMASYFFELLKAVIDGLRGIVYKVGEYTQKIGGFVSDIVYQVANPDEHAKKMAQLRAEDLLDQKKNLDERVRMQKDAYDKQLQINKGRAGKVTGLAEVNLAGIGEAAEGKSPKQVAKEQAWRSTQWQKTAGEVSAAAMEYGKAQAALTAVQADKNLLGSETDLDAQKRMLIAEQALAATRGTGIEAAKKAGVGGEGLTGIGKAMDVLVKQQADTARYEALAAEQAQKLQEAQANVQAFTQANAATITDALGQAAMGASDAGIAVVDDFARGINNPDANKLLQDSVFGASDMVSKSMTTHSPILEGPLMGVGGGGESDPAWIAGRTLMESMALGIESGTTVVSEAVARALDESVFATFDAYKIKMAELAKKKSLLNDVADMMMRDFGREGSIVNTITVDDKTEDVRSNMKAMLNVPGLAGVTMAIMNEGAKQRAILDKIRGFTQVIAESELIKNGGSPTAKPVVLG